MHNSMIAALIHQFGEVDPETKRCSVEISPETLSKIDPSLFVTVNHHPDTGAVTLTIEPPRAPVKQADGSIRMLPQHLIP